MKISFNRSQKSIALIFLAVSVASFIIWIAYGGEIFTKSEILVDVYDEVFDTTYKEWRDKFIWGLDLSLLIVGSSFIISSILIFLKRTKKLKSISH